MGDTFHFGGPTASSSGGKKMRTSPLKTLDLPGKGDEAAMMEYIAGKNSTPEERERLHKGSVEEGHIMVSHTDPEKPK